MSKVGPPINLDNKIPASQGLKRNQLGLIAPPRRRDISAPIPFNRTSSSISGTDSLNFPTMGRPQAHRGPLNRPNLSPLAGTGPIAPINSFNRPRPINLPVTVNPQHTREVEVQTATSVNPFLAFARRLSPRSNNLNFNRNSQLMSIVDINNNTADSIDAHRDNTNNNSNNRRISPTYADNRPESLFPSDMKDVSQFMSKLLASNPPQVLPSPAMRRIRSLTPKILMRGKSKSFSAPKVTVKKLPPGSSPLVTNPPLLACQPSVMESFPMEILEMVFLLLESPNDILNCSLTCQRWRMPGQSALKRYLQLRPYADLPMLKALRLGLSKPSTITKGSSVPSSLHERVAALSVDFCHSNPFIYPKLRPKNPETLVNNLFWIFLFLDRAFQDPNHRGVNCNQFIKLVHRGILEDIDRATLKALYLDIKANPLTPSVNLDEEDSDLQGKPNQLAIQPLLPHPMRRWWRRVSTKVFGADSDNDPLSDVEEEEDPFRPI